MVTTKKNLKYEKETVTELKKAISKLTEEKKRLKEKLGVAKLNLARIMGVRKTKLALFEFIKNLRVEEISLEKDRENYLLESCLLNHLAKESMKKYRKITAQSFRKLKLIQNDEGVKFYQSFNQDEFRPYKGEEREKSLTELEKDANPQIEKLDKYFAKKVIGDNQQQLLGIFHALHEVDKK
ncbi:19008_t:CDS:2 [Funneliformis geosporum]|uniref:19008_t:CDS:1 n=1 Tax=Funneliformis geosporum TaxID=1117311 RepID=A0A9W4SCE5_9GLOM|nr:19008_t:CDS:2 [Funneliformis geosporum]